VTAGATVGASVTTPGRRFVRDHCLAPSRAVDAPAPGARYGRMFPGLPPLSTDPDLLYSAGSPGGVCDAASVPTRLVSEARQAAGWPFFGQFVAHDITADRSLVSVRADVEALRNARSPRLNLEMLHAEGPVGAPYLFDARDPALMLTGPDGRDLPRNSQGTALIGDPRNDVHRFVAHLHLAFLHVHNRLVERLREDGVGEDDVFEQARRALVWHYQWIVVNDFLPRLVGADLVAGVLADGGRYFAPEPGAAYVPLEFADAAYRYGHGQIRHRYRLRAGGAEYPLFPDLFGHGPIPAEHQLDWELLFDLPGLPPAQRAKRLDGSLPGSLITLPPEITGEVAVAAHRSLAVRDLIRGRATALPSGEAVAELLGVPPLTARQVGREWAGGTPLWLYVLKEADHRGGGDRLGPVGGRIVAEVLIGLLRADADSFLAVQPDWRPTLPSAGETFGLADLLTFSTS
jgi:hypothetical protein